MEHLRFSQVEEEVVLNTEELGQLRELVEMVAVVPEETIRGL
jgi:hypothetical protein